MIDFNIITGILVAAGLIVLLRFVFPYLEAKGLKSDIYKDVKMGLLMFGYAFRDEKIKKITNLMLGIVTSVEALNVAPEEKKKEALEIAFTELMEELNVILDKEALSLIINIAVSYLPPTDNENHE